MTETPQAIVAGHICLDIIPSLAGQSGQVEPLLMPGKLVNIGPATTATGGAVSNTGQALHRLGIRTKLMGKIGDDLFGRGIRDLLDALNPALSAGMIVAPGEPTSYTVVLSAPDFDRIFLHCPGANDTFAADDLDPAELSGAGLFHFGYPPLMKRMYQNDGAELARLLETAKQAGLTVSLDLSLPDPASESGQVDWEAILTATLPHVDVFLPSLDEILFMLDRERFEALRDNPQPVSGDLLKQLADRLMDMGPPVVGLKLGEGGFYLRTTDAPRRFAAGGPTLAGLEVPRWRDRHFHVPCFGTTVAGTTGSGDCTIAGFLAGLLHKLPPEDAALAAVGTGAFNVEAPDATSGIPDWQVLRDRIAAGWEQLDSPLQPTGCIQPTSRGIRPG
jgi:sugar/nucleoside kinase (ribokinase family)